MTLRQINLSAIAQLFLQGRFECWSPRSQLPDASGKSGLQPDLPVRAGSLLTAAQMLLLPASARVLLRKGKSSPGLALEQAGSGFDHPFAMLENSVPVATKKFDLVL